MEQSRSTDAALFRRRGHSCCALAANAHLSSWKSDAEAGRLPVKWCHVTSSLVSVGVREDSRDELMHARVCVCVRGFG